MSGASQVPGEKRSCSTPSSLCACRETPWLCFSPYFPPLPLDRSQSKDTGLLLDLGTDARPPAAETGLILILVPREQTEGGVRAPGLRAPHKLDGEVFGAESRACSLQERTASSPVIHPSDSQWEMGSKRRFSSPELGGYTLGRVYWGRGGLALVGVPFFRCVPSAV